MILKLRQRMAQEESGFTLVELLVVMLILGLLAAIAIPAFFNQSDKAKDADAKASVKTAQTAMETYATEQTTGAYTGATAANLKTIESTLNDAPNAADLSVVVAGSKEYAVAVKSVANDMWFSIHRASGGQTDLKCGQTLGANGIAGGTVGGGCPPGNTWG
jgi:type IV pilus assembly protein PilA